MGAMGVDMGSGVVIEEKECRTIRLQRCVGIALPAQDVELNQPVPPAAVWIPFLNEPGRCNKLWLQGLDGEPQRKLIFTKFRPDYALRKRAYKQVIPRKLHI